MSRSIAPIIIVAGCLHIAFGVAQLAVPRLQLTDEIGNEIPEPMRIAFGVILIILSKGLRERRRWAWISAVVLSLLEITINLDWMLQFPKILFLLPTIIVMTLMVTFRRTFTVRAENPWSYGRTAAAIGLCLALAYGIGGAYSLRDDFKNIETLSDAVYFALVTYSTLGYDDVVTEMYPRKGSAHWFVMSMFLIGITLFITALSVTVGPIVQGRMKGIMSLLKRLKRMRDHVIVCGYSSVAARVIEELHNRNTMGVIIDERENVSESLRSKGIDVLEGDPTLSDTLMQANVVAAKAVVATYDSDSRNTLVAVRAKDLRDTENARFAILVRIEHEESVEMVRRLGVDHVISPSSLGARLLAERAAYSGGEKG